jgi:hypothetical protein
VGGGPNRRRGPRPALGGAASALRPAPAGALAPQDAVPPAAGQQQPPRQRRGAFPVPAVDALAVAEQAVSGAAVACAVPAVPAGPGLGHGPLRGGLARRGALALLGLLA